MGQPFKQNQNATCSECKEEFLVGVVLPYYFARYEKVIWLCVKCKDPVHERYRILK